MSTFWPNFQVRTGMRYTDYNPKNGGCRYVFLSDRAYAAIISEVLRNGDYETGGVLLGNAYNKNWFVTDCIDPGVQAYHAYADFQLDVEYVNRAMDNIRHYYQYPLTFLGFWHRHPQSLDTFSKTDEDTIRSNLRNCQHGMLSMLVNIDPELRMTFYYCYNETLMRVPYDAGDEYFPQELLRIASPAELTARMRSTVRIRHKRLMDPNKMPKHLPVSVTGRRIGNPSSTESAPAQLNRGGGTAAGQVYELGLDVVQHGITDREAAANAPGTERADTVKQTASLAAAKTESQDNSTYSDVEAALSERISLEENRSTSESAKEETTSASKIQDTLKRIEKAKETADKANASMASANLSIHGGAPKVEEYHLQDFPKAE